MHGFANAAKVVLLCVGQVHFLTSFGFSSGGSAPFEAFVTLAVTDSR